LTYIVAPSNGFRFAGAWGVVAGTTGLGLAPAQPAAAVAAVNVKAKIREILDCCLDVCMGSSKVARAL
jgi:hypothetical protein